MNNDQIANPIEYILNSPLSGVLSKGFAELYRNKPDFPVSYLGNWLKEYSRNQKRTRNTKQLVQKQAEQYANISKQKAADKQICDQKLKAQISEVEKADRDFLEKLQATVHLEDLLRQWLPQYIQKRYEITGAYIGFHTHPYKPLELHNFEANAQFDTESPKFIEYVGSSKSHESLMYMKVLPSETGVSYSALVEPEAQPEQQKQQGEQIVKKEAKKTYLYVPDVTKNENIYYFKFPKLGSYACFPIKLKSFIIQQSFDQGVELYKEYVKQKDQTEKEYNEKVNQARQQYEQAVKKYEEFEIPEQPNPDAQAQRNALKEEQDKAQTVLNQLESNPPLTPEPEFNNIQKCYILGIDTLGQDKKIKEEDLSNIDKHSKDFKRIFEAKQKEMLLEDILTFVEDEPKLENLESVYRDFQKTAVSNAEEAAKQKTTKEKQLQFETSVHKCKKMEGIFEDAGFQKSMKTYFSYNIPKYQEVLQIGLMLVGEDKQNINMPRTNQLDFRKVLQQKYHQKMMEKLSEYNLRPESSSECHSEYKISKLLERLEKIDLEQVIKYNGFIWALALHLKNMCWCRLQGRDSHIQAYELSVKAKEERDGEIQKYNEQLQKAYETYKSELEEGAEGYTEQQWTENYKKQNSQPQPLEPIEQKEFLDLE